MCWFVTESQQLGCFLSRHSLTHQRVCTLLLDMMQNNVFKSQRLTKNTQAAGGAGRLDWHPLISSIPCSGWEEHDNKLSDISTYHRLSQPANPLKLSSHSQIMPMLANEEGPLPSCFIFFILRRWNSPPYDLLTHDTKSLL